VTVPYPVGMRLQQSAACFMATLVNMLLVI
jgi:hypothetical protein